MRAANTALHAWLPRPQIRLRPRTVPIQDNESSASCTLDWGNMPNFLINEGLESEEVITAARATEGNIQWWFYDDCNRAQETRLQRHVQTIREVVNP